MAHLIAHSGDMGRRWAEEYQSPACARLRRDLRQALALLRGYRIAAGRHLLDAAGERLRELGAAPSVRQILTREHRSVLAYLFYLQEDLEQAEELLNAAQQAVRAAIEMQPCLVPHAIHCQEYCFQRARIARSRRRWDEMRRILDVARALVEDEAPLCVLSDGTPILFSTLDVYYRSLQGLGEGEAAYVRDLTDTDRRRRDLERFIDGLYLIPGFVIPFA
jgi:hypothetical protein